MIITISGANFSASNIGTLSTWTVSKSIGAGAEHSIPSYVDKNSAFNYTITLKDGYTFGTYSVTMGGQTITPTVTETSITINIASVTGAIRIDVKTINSSTGEPEEPGTGGDTPSNKVTITLNVTPSDAKAMIHKDAITTGVLLTEGIGSASISVDKGTVIVCSATKEGYYSKTENLGSVNEDKTVSLTCESMNRPAGTNIAQNGTLYEKKSLSSGSYSMTDNVSYYVWDQIPVEAGATYKVSGGLRAWWLKSDKKQINTINFKNENYTATAPTNAAYVSITFPYSSVNNPQDAWLIKTN